MQNSIYQNLDLTPSRTILFSKTWTSLHHAYFYLPKPELNITVRPNNNIGREAFGKGIQEAESQVGPNVPNRQTKQWYIDILSYSHGFLCVYIICRSQITPMPIEQTLQYSMLSISLKVTYFVIYYDWSNWKIRFQGRKTSELSCTQPA